ncbi:hypothetical protein [Actinokineospora enzanensis]|uniref:hypothetical protein n=1 Tax=Actinokineospora enzanensis TaxID=155975 RepID=UPI00037470EB|nr:hypothetical protein [Actinokineospora enzanensis]
MSDPHRPGAPWPPEQYNRSGETEWIPRVQGGRRPDEPFQFQDETPPAAGNPALTWALRIAGLVAVAVISGLVYWYIADDKGPDKHTADPGPTTQAQAGRFVFTAHPDMPRPQVDNDCAKNSYANSKVAKFFGNSPCVNLTRQLFTTEVEGKKIYTSVSVVKMPDTDAAGDLQALTKKDGTGNVDDPIKAKLVKVDGLPSLGKGGFQSALHGAQVVIVESDWAPSADRSKTEQEWLKDISADAIRLGDDITGA